MFLVDVNLRVLGYSNEDDALYRALTEPLDPSDATGVRATIARCARDGESTAVLADGSVLRVIAMHGMGACYACTIEPLRAASAKLDRCSQRFGLSVRETEVLRLLARGRRSVEIAGELGICETTVVTHIRNIGIKTGSRRRSSIIALALGPE